MKCPACGGDYQAGDRFCGTCGERLPEAAPAGNRPDAGGSGSAVAVEPRRESSAAAASASAQCPVCGAGLAAGAIRCEVCGFEPGASVVLPGSPLVQAQSAAPVGRVNLEPSTAARVCPIHGPLDPSWTRCPYCLKEGLEGRLPSGPVGLRPGGEGPPPLPPPVAVAAPPAPAPHRMEPGEAIIPPAPAGGSPPAIAAQAVPAAGPPPAPPGSGELPQSSVGGTVAIRRRSRVLAYLIEREGEAVGRVHQLDDDFTDMGRDPRNHIVLTDVKISGFHARVERGPDGGFVLQDRNSTNGTWHNGEPVSEPRRLEENDELRMGSTVLVLKVVS